MNNMEVWGRNILGRGKSKCKGAEVRMTLAFFDYIEGLIWLEGNERRRVARDGV